MSKQTAVEWLVEQLLANALLRLTKDEHSVYKELKDQAKAMEREQMINAYSNGWHDGQDVILQQCKHIDKGGDDAGQKHYNSTYKGGEQ